MSVTTTCSLGLGGGDTISKSEGLTRKLAAMRVRGIKCLPGHVVSLTLFH